MLATIAATLAFSPARAMANCALEPKITFSYPNEATRDVPLDAVFWAVAKDSRVSFRLDGVELQHPDRSDVGLSQFAPAEPLSPGMHDIEISNEQTLSGQPLESGERLRFRVNAIEQPRVEADATIEAVSYFPLVGGNTSYPPPQPNEQPCAWVADLLQSCNDLIPASLTRIEFSTQGDAIGILIGHEILAPGCNYHYPYEFFAGDDAPYSIRAILPTGLTEARLFEPDPALIASVTPPEDVTPPTAAPASAPAVQPAAEADSCALHAPTNGASPLSLLWLGAAAAVAVGLRRR